jgi:hypothetical protein
MRKLTITYAIAIFALAAAGRRSLGADDGTSFHRSIPNYLPCPGFTIRGEFDIDRTTTTFFGDAGTASELFNTSTPTGRSATRSPASRWRTRASFKITVDLTTGERTIVGNLNTATAPGGGDLPRSRSPRLRAGREHLREPEPHDDADNNFGALCDYLPARP